MEKKIGVVIVLSLLVLSMSFSSASWFSDVWDKISGNGITGNAVVTKTTNSGVSCSIEGKIAVNYKPDGKKCSTNGCWEKDPKGRKATSGACGPVVVKWTNTKCTVSSWDCGVSYSAGYCKGELGYRTKNIPSCGSSKGSCNIGRKEEVRFELYDVNCIPQGSISNPTEEDNTPIAESSPVIQESESFNEAIPSEPLVSEEGSQETFNEAIPSEPLVSEEGSQETTSSSDVVDSSIESPSIEPQLVESNCILTNYSEWSECIDNQQSRNLLYKSPDNCIPGEELTRYCDEETISEEEILDVMNDLEIREINSVEDIFSYEDLSLFLNKSPLRAVIDISSGEVDVNSLNLEVLPIVIDSSEICNGIDDNGDGRIDEYCDVDMDGFYNSNMVCEDFFYGWKYINNSLYNEISLDESVGWNHLLESGEFLTYEQYLIHSMELSNFSLLNFSFDPEYAENGFNVYSAGEGWFFLPQECSSGDVDDLNELVNPAMIFCDELDEGDLNQLGLDQLDFCINKTALFESYKFEETNQNGDSSLARSNQEEIINYLTEGIPTPMIPSYSGEEVDNEGLLSRIVDFFRNFKFSGFAISKTNFSITGFASKLPTCGALGSSKGYAQSQLECQASKCSKGYSSIGSSRDCNVCCAKGSPGSSSSTSASKTSSSSSTPSSSKLPTCGALGSSKGYAQSQLECQASKCSKGYSSIGSSRDCNVCCAKGSPGSSSSTSASKTSSSSSTPSSSKLPTCGALGSSKGYAQSQLECQASKCSKGYSSIGSSRDCNVCCAKGGDVKVVSSNVANTASSTNTATAQKSVSGDPCAKEVNKLCTAEIYNGNAWSNVNVIEGSKPDKDWTKTFNKGSAKFNPVDNTCVYTCTKPSSRWSISSVIKIGQRHTYFLSGQEYYYCDNGYVAVSDSGNSFTCSKKLK